MNERSDVLPMGKLRERLRAIRQARGMTLDEVAGLANLTANQVSLIELSKRGLDIEELVVLCRALRVDLRDVVTVDPLPMTWVA